MSAPSTSSDNGDLSTPWDRVDTWRVAGAAALAFVLRLTLALMSPVVGGDSYAFLMFASELGRGIWAGGFNDGVHPAYPLAIAGLKPLLGSAELAGYAVSVFFSALTVLPYYALVRDVAGRRVALLSALLFGCFPFHILVHGAIMTEGLFHFFFITSAAFSWFGASRSDWRHYVLAGLSGGLAYLTRPEGIYTPLATLGLTVMLVAEAKFRKQPPKLRRLAFATGSVLVFLCVALPLLLQFREMTGHWVFSNRSSVKSGFRAFGGGDGGPSDWSGALRKIAVVGLATGTVALPAAAFGIWAGRRRMKGVGAAYFLCIAAGYALPAAAVAAGGYALSRRYLLIPIVFLFPFVSVAGLALTDRLSRRGDPRRVAWAASAVFALALLAASIRAVHPKRWWRDVPTKTAALWLRERSGPRTLVHANTTRAMYYLGARTQSLPETLADLETWELGEEDYALVVERALKKQHPAGMEIMERRFERIARFPAEDESKVDVVSIFVLRRPR